MNIWRDVLFLGTLFALAGCGSSSVDEDDDDDTSNSGFFPEDSTGGVSSDYGPDNSWYHAGLSEVPEGLAGTGKSAGDIMQNLYLTDQFGDDVELYQFYGQAVLLDVYAEW